MGVFCFIFKLKLLQFFLGDKQESDVISLLLVMCFGGGLCLFKETHRKRIG